MKGVYYTYGVANALNDLFIYYEPPTCEYACNYHKVVMALSNKSYFENYDDEGLANYIVQNLTRREWEWLL